MHFWDFVICDWYMVLTEGIDGTRYGIVWTSVGFGVADVL